MKSLFTCKFEWFKSWIVLILSALALQYSASIASAQSISFNPAVNYKVEAGPVTVAIGDFDNDGNLDLAVANQGSASFSILLGSSDGTFGSVSNFSSGTQPAELVVGDFNDDGKPDVAVASVIDDNVSIHLGIGDGTFGTAMTFVAGTQPSALVTADFDLDGNLDLAVANIVSNNISVHLGVGDGTFVTSGTFFAGAPRSIETGDFNDDGTPDLAVASLGFGAVSIFLGVGDGSFGFASNYPAGSPISIAIGDLNNDGTPDVVAGRLFGNNFSVLLSLGGGTFGVTTSVVSSNPRSVELADFDNDGKADVAAGNFGGNSVSIHPGLGNGLFGAVVSFFTGSGGPTELASGDFNGDGLQDLAVVNIHNGSVSILLNATVTDADGDGVLDDDDLCPATFIPESVPTNSLKPNHWALTDTDFNFDTILTGAGRGSVTSYTTSDTAGCSCQQIIDKLGLGNGLLKHGCPMAIMDSWLNIVAGAPKKAVIPSLGISTDFVKLNEVPTTTKIHGNYPNPFNPTTTIRYDLPESAQVKLSVFDVMGREVRVLVHGPVAAGTHEVTFDASSLPSGTYIYQLTTPGGKISKTMLLLK